MFKIICYDGSTTRVVTEELQEWMNHFESPGTTVLPIFKLRSQNLYTNIFRSLLTFNNPGVQWFRPRDTHNSTDASTLQLCNHILEGVQLQCYAFHTQTLVGDISVDRVEVFVLLDHVLIDTHMRLFPQGCYPPIMLAYCMYATSAYSLFALKSTIHKVFGYEVMSSKIRISSNKSIAPVLEAQKQCDIAASLLGLIDMDWVEHFDKAFVTDESPISVGIVETTVAHAYRALSMGFIAPEALRLQLVVGDFSDPKTMMLVNFIAQPLSYIRWKQKTGNKQQAIEPKLPSVLAELIAELPSCEALLRKISGD